MTAPEIKNTAEFEADAADSASHAPGLARSRIIVFVGVFLSILLVANWLVGATWDHFLGSTAGPAWKIIPLGLTFTFIAATILGRRYSNFALRLAYRISAAWLGILSFSFFAACAIWIVSAAATWLHLPSVDKAIAETFFGAAALASIYGLVNANRLKVTRITVNLPNLPTAWQGRTVALVTDLHLGSVRGSRFTRRVVAKLQSLQPAAVFISGDLFDGPEANPDALVEPWRQLSVPEGTFFVTGNHEEFGDRAKLVDAVRRTGIRVLHNEKVDVQGLQIVGVHDRETGDPQEYRAVLRQAGLDSGRASILLAHQPASLAIAEEAGISLQLSGHTHGGQFWPWTWAAARVHGRFNYGLNRFGKLQVYTSSGAGTWGMPLRVGTKSEIVLIHLSRNQAVESVMPA
ncbi:MAG TPA: metallophosphoesterase [Candidatus Limnocylindria bacterium]|nr:metallophosphoesterase [Candidatus Limnocylindria bacterium]